MNRYAVGKVDEIRQAGRAIVEVKGLEIGVFYIDGEFFAWRNVCPHAGAPVCQGPVCGTRLPSLVYEYEYGQDAQILRCPWHGWEFDLKTGEHLASDSKLKGYPVQVEEDQVYVVFRSRG